MASANEVIDEVVHRVLDDRPFEAGEEVCVLINGSGSTTLMEMFILYRQAHQILQDNGLSVYRAKIGEFITTQEMAGFSFSLCALDDELKRFWDAPADCPYFTVR